MLTRRDVLQKYVALGSIVIASHFSPEAMLAAFQDREKQVRKPTPPNALGPFYKRLAPSNNMLCARGSRHAADACRSSVQHAWRRGVRFHDRNLVDQSPWPIR